MMKNLFTVVALVCLSGCGPVSEVEDADAYVRGEGPLDRLVYMLCTEDGCAPARIPADELYYPPYALWVTNWRSWDRLCGTEDEDPGNWVEERDFVVADTYCVIDSYLYCSMDRIEAVELTGWLAGLNVCNYPVTLDTQGFDLP